MTRIQTIQAERSNIEESKMHKKMDKTKTIWTDASPLAFIHVGDGQWWFTTVVWPHGDKP